MFGVHNFFSNLSVQSRILVTTLCAVIILIPAIVHSDCGARCDYTNAINLDVNGTTTSHDLIQPTTPDFPDCRRIFIVEVEQQDNLADETDKQTWKYQESDGDVSCAHNSGVHGTSIVGENLTGPKIDIDCFKDCIEVVE